MKRQMEYLWAVPLLLAMLVLQACGSAADLAATQSNPDGMSTISVSVKKASGGTQTDILSADSPTVAEATVLDSSGRPVSGVVVTFTTTLAQFNPGSGKALTDGNGRASIQMVAGSATGADILTAGATLADGSNVSGSKGYQVLAPSLQLGSGTPFSAGTLSIGTSTVAAGGTTSVSARLVDASGNPYLTPVDVSFASTCFASGKATLSSPVTTVDGVATSTYLAKGCVGSDSITATATVGGTSFTASGSLTVQAATLGSITFVSATPTNIALKGTGGAGRSESAVVIFKVLNSQGLPMQNQQVSFSLTTELGGLSLSPAAATTDDNGQAQTTIASGTVATPVRVTATVAGASGQSLTTQSDQLVVSTGVADQAHASISAETLNPEAWNKDGVSVPITIRLADHFGNPVPDGTAVSFTSEGGSIGPSCTTMAGGCSVNWISQNPRPANGRVTILAYAQGEESYTDVNGNGRYDADPNGDGSTSDREPFTDLPEAFRDDNESRAYETGENFYDFNVDGSYTAANGMFNGPSCRSSTVGGCLTTGVHVRDALVLTMSSNNVLVALSPTAVNVGSGPVAVAINVMDEHGNPAPLGTKVELSTTNGKLSSTNFAIPNDSTSGGNTFYVTVSSDGTPSSGTLTATVTAPDGTKASASITVAD